MRAACVQGDSTMHARGGQEARHRADGVVGHRDEDVRGVLGDLGVGDGLRRATHEGGGGGGTLRTAAGYGRDGFAAVAQQTSESWPQAARTGDCDWLWHRFSV